MFETHSQQIKVHLSAELVESFAGVKGKTANRHVTGIQSRVEMKRNLHITHKFKFDTIRLMPKYLQFFEYTRLKINY